MENFKKIKKNRSDLAEREKGGGFALLFTMVVVSIILAVTIGAINIAYNEINFSTSGKDTNDAFFAADTGVECALYYDYGQGVGDDFPNPNYASTTCAGSPIDIKTDSSSSWSFIAYKLGSSGQSCAVVTIAKDATKPLTTVISKGYDKGGASAVNCGNTANQVERELDVTY